MKTYKIIQMKNTFLFLIFSILIFSCKKEATKIQVQQEKQLSKDGDALKPSNGYNQYIRLYDAKGKPVRDKVNDLIATGISSTEIQLSFSAVTSQYYVYRDGFYIATISSGFYIDGGLLPGSSHSYQVKSSDKFAQLSNTATATTLTGGGSGGGGGSGEIKNVLMLDFDGGTENGTTWAFDNMNFAGANISIDEINFIVDSVQRAFNAVDQRIIVTTDESIAQNTDPFYFQRTYITETNFRGSVGGVSYIGSYNYGDRTANFVFSQLLYYNPGYIVTATMHENGHAFGLRHDSCGGNYGYSGNWMGGSYGKPGFFEPKLDVTCTFVDQPAFIRSKLF